LTIKIRKVKANNPGKLKGVFTNSKYLSGKQVKEKPCID